MKKLLSLMGCGVLCIALAGCSGSGADVVCTKESKDSTEKYSIYAEDDKVTKLEMELEAEASSEEEAKMVETLYEGIFGGIADESDGAVDSSINRSGKTITVEVTIDVKAAKKAGTTGSYLPDETNLDDFIENVESNGYKCD